MIIKNIFHTYKDNFPLLIPCNGRVYLSFDFPLMDEFKNLIIELSEFSRMTSYCYITRHTDDVIPESHLRPFKERFTDFVDRCGENSNFGIPTVWFVIYSENEEAASLIKKELERKNIKYFDDSPSKYDSIECIPPGNYARTNDEARMFPKFLHHTTQISIDLLRIGNPVSELQKFKTLEFMRGNDLDLKIKELEIYLETNSNYYREKIKKNKHEKQEFWTNFRIVYNGYSWPHFLFNTCGA